MITTDGLSVEVERDGPLVRVVLTVRVDEEVGDILLPYERAAKILGCSVRTLQRYIGAGLIDRVLDGRRRHPSGHAVPCVALDQLLDVLQSEHASDSEEEAS